MVKEKLYSKEAVSYFSNGRLEYIDLIPGGRLGAILEIGCGTGETGEYALRTKCDQYMGVELIDSAAKAANQKLTEVIAGDVENAQLPWPNCYFDALVMSEVLEHLIHPWSVMKNLTRLLKPGAIVVAGTPNISSLRVIAQLIRGRFDYEDRGLMDESHLRWFTPGTLREMFEAADIETISIGSAFPPKAGTRMIDAITFKRLSHLFYSQITYVGKYRQPHTDQCPENR